MNGEGGELWGLGGMLGGEPGETGERGGASGLGAWRDLGLEGGYIGAGGAEDSRWRRWRAGVEVPCDAKRNPNAKKRVSEVLRVGV